ncbi:TlpA family protein disulfide reductase [Sinirhodobacter huangdaonensis]|uniref:TlpA family protein disulfide reductase n=1 Tax=Paenirhodobacter huangdaonensis TaxID=2501515 RepID=A0A3S4MLQ2_9RHOB|nr:TlpA disulfide reductase family protein [Sinirhodobacter huangdaonensis]RWR54946.1 TlpA family protein disulfide reductase [Sinirhodobacter huangdaonensis]
MLRLFVLYTALSLTANAAAAADLGALKSGDMRKLVVYEQPLATPELPFVDETGAEHRLTEFRGKVVLLNLWATWCAPCRVEMPGLDALQGELGGADFQVVTLATGRNPQPKIAKFFDEAGVTRLPRFQDEKQTLSRAMGVMGLPVSVLIDRDGHEVARLIGEADWNGPEARAVIGALIAD